VRASAELIRGTARAATEDLRRVLGVLRADGEVDDARLAPQPDLDDIPAMVESSRAAGLRVELQMGAPEVPGIVGRTAYRVVQEGLTNVHKHAPGSVAVVVLAVTDGRLSVEVVNRRPVGSATLLPGAGAGLVGLRERVGLLGGTVTAGATSEGGWRLAASLPLDEPVP
jgi:signal transduction histidine kinase